MAEGGGRWAHAQPCPGPEPIDREEKRHETKCRDGPQDPSPGLLPSSPVTQGTSLSLSGPQFPHLKMEWQGMNPKTVPGPPGGWQRLAGGFIWPHMCCLTYVLAASLWSSEIPTQIPAPLPSHPVTPGLRSPGPQQAAGRVPGLPLRWGHMRSGGGRAFLGGPAPRPQGAEQPLKGPRSQGPLHWVLAQSQTDPALMLTVNLSPSAHFLEPQFPPLSMGLASQGGGEARSGGTQGGSDDDGEALIQHLGTVQLLLDLGWKDFGEHLSRERHRGGAGRPERPREHPLTPSQRPLASWERHALQPGGLSSQASCLSPAEVREHDHPAHADALPRALQLGQLCPVRGRLPLHGAPGRPPQAGECQSGLHP